MAQELLNLEIIRGCDFAGAVIECYDEDDELIDVSDWTFEAQARIRTNAALGFAFSVAPGVSLGTAVIAAMTSEATLLLSLGTFGYDVVPITPAGVRLPPILAETVTVKDINTRPA